MHACIAGWRAAMGIGRAWQLPHTAWEASCTFRHRHGHRPPPFAPPPLQGLPRDGVLEGLHYALRKARAERDGEIRESDALFNQLQEAKAANEVRVGRRAGGGAHCQVVAEPAATTPPAWPLAAHSPLAPHSAPPTAPGMTSVRVPSHSMPLALCRSAPPLRPSLPFSQELQAMRSMFQAALTSLSQGWGAIRGLTQEVDTLRELVAAGGGRPARGACLPAGTCVEVEGCMWLAGGRRGRPQAAGRTDLGGTRNRGL
jgi:hypothetical protein